MLNKKNFRIYKSLYILNYQIYLITKLKNIKNVILILFFSLYLNFLFINHVYAQSNLQFGEVYFSPDTSLEEQFIGYLKRSTGTILIAANSLNSTKICETLIELRIERLIPIKILLYKPNAINNKYIEKFLFYGINVVLAENSAGFDYNFCILDFNSVWISSANFTYESLNRDFNYALIINDEKIAENFYREFNEMFEGNSYGATSPSTTVYPVVNINNNIIETSFLPEDIVDAKIVSIISKAKSKIKILATELKNIVILDSILSKKNNITDISVILEYGTNDNIISKFEFEQLKQNGIYAVYNKKYNFLNINVILIDDKIVMLFGKNKMKDNTTNSDSFLIVITSNQLATNYSNFFDNIMQKNTFDISLTGQVKNTTNNLPLERTIVSIPELNISTLTDHLGWYEIKGELPNEFLVSFEREYYFSKELIYPKKNGKRLDISLKSIETYNSLSGFVLEKNTNIPINNCTIRSIYIEPETGTKTYIKTVTNEKGFFVLNGVPVGKIELEITHPLYNRYTEKNIIITKGNPIVLNSPIYLIANYIITAYPNPIFEDNLLIAVKDSKITSNIPKVTIKQNNYAEIDVPMQVVASTDLKNLYVGNYIIKKGYYGIAKIIVNDGEAIKDINIDFLQAYKNYTYQSANKNVSFSLDKNIIKKDGYLFTIVNDLNENILKLNNTELKLVDNLSLNINSSRNLSLNYEMLKTTDNLIEFTLNNINCNVNLHNLPKIYYFNSQINKWQILDTYIKKETLNNKNEIIKLSTNFNGLGKYAVFLDETPPKIEKVFKNNNKYLITLLDEGAGLNNKSLSLLNNNYNLSITSISDNNLFKKEFLVSLPINYNEKELVDLKFNVSDNANNCIIVSFNDIINLTHAINNDIKNITIDVYPNPFKSFVKFKIKNAMFGECTISIYDQSNTLVINLCDNRLITTNNEELNFNLDFLKNGVYFYKIKFSNGINKFGKLVKLK